mgnify:CR=1 FL=1|tara:strand:- start:203 stop:673 length:471 start_codon:yes stop_codon:yes gene_type:complete
MFYKKINALIFVFFLFIIFSFNVHAKNYTSKVYISSHSQDFEFSVEIAITEEERKKGLMFRKSLAIDKGMLFVFPKEDIVKIWMKNTFIPLDIIFISSDYLIMRVVKNAQPLEKRIYSSESKVKYVLEINSGLVEKYDIEKGCKVKIEKYTARYSD